MDSARQSRHVCQQPSNVGGCRQYTNRGCPFPCIAELCGLHSKFLSMQHMQHAQAKPRCGTSVVDCTFTNLSKSSCHDGNGSLRLSRNPPRSLLIQEPCPAVQRQGANLRNFTSSQLGSHAFVRSVACRKSEATRGQFCACTRVHPSRTTKSTSDTLLMPLAAILWSLSSAKKLTQIGGRAFQTAFR